MSAETLRKAAALMRERAEAAPPGPWFVYDGGTHRCVGTEALPGRRWRQVGYATESLPDSAQHIASWHPAVALAVADWLEHEARLIEENDKARANDPGLRPVPKARVDRSLAVAAVYLGEDA